MTWIVTKEDIDMTNIKRARLLAGLNQVEAAAKLGVTDRTLRTYEKGGEIPSTVLVKLARLTGMSADYLLGLKDRPEIIKEENK